VSAAKSNVLPQDVIDEVEFWRVRFPADQVRSLTLPALRALQHHHHGYLEAEGVQALAAYLGLPDSYLFEVATFYSMFELKPVGRHSISVCTNISCMLVGADDILNEFERVLGIRHGESTPDGRFYLKVEEECIAACASAPVVQIDHVYYENLGVKDVEPLLERVDDVA